MEKVEVGTIWLPKEIIQKIEEHKEMMMKANPAQKEIFENASFGMWFNDWLLKKVHL